MSAPLQFPLKDIELVTNNFDKENFIGEGFLGKIYEGQLSLSGELVDVAVRRLDNSFRLQEIAFEKEISTLTRIEHPNVVSIVGFCYENDEMLIIQKRVARGSLSSYLSDPRLTWMRRLQISVGAVRALSYLHNDVGHNFSVIHHNINCNSILLDENWEAKISGFEYSMTIPAGGLDLAYEKLGIGTYKSDVYSIGIVLFELLCGREAFISKDDKSFQSSLATFHYKNRKLHEFVDADLYSQMDQLSFKLFSKIAYTCLIDQRAPPTMNDVLKRLERALKVQKTQDNNDHSKVAVERTIPDHLNLKMKSLEHMRIRLDDIVTATENFAGKYCIVSGGFGSVYIAELDHVDKAYCFAIGKEIEREVPKKRGTVAIKCIIDTEDEIAEQGFYAEIKMLTSCKHSNIITLLGFCDEGGKMILIYEYASNGSLNYYLQKMNNNPDDSWAHRLKICLDVAKGLSFLHTNEGELQEIVHRDIKSANILLDENFKAKIGDFGLSIFLSVSEEHHTPYSSIIVGTPGYMDPQYSKNAKLKKELDVYSFGVLMLEILCGTVAYDPKFTNNKGLALLARQHFNKGTIKEMVDHKIIKEITETLFTSVEGPDQESLDTFSKIAFKCLAEAQVERPTMEIVVKELEKAQYLQENRKDVLQISLKDIQLATNNFNCENFIGSSGFSKVYRGEVLHPNGQTTRIVVKRFLHQGNDIYYDFANELTILVEHQHENVIALFGYCEEGEERIAVYEYMSNGSLDKHLDNASLTWGKRLKIAIDIASGLDFLHGGFVTGKVVIHRDIRSRNILLDGEMRAKIATFGFSKRHSIEQKTVIFPAIGATLTYVDPEYERTGVLSKECDIYAFGIVLFEIMFRSLAYSKKFEKYDFLGTLIKRLYKEGKLDNMVFEGTNEQIASQSLSIFRRVAIQCLHENREERPTAGQVIIQLKNALQIQEKGLGIVRIPFEDIKYATNNFSNEKCIATERHGKVYKGQLPHANGHEIIAAKRWDRIHGQEYAEFHRELEILFKFKHRNVIHLEGYCDEMDEKITVYEYAFNGSLDKWLDNISLTWTKRLEICIGVASGLDFLHGDVLRQETVIHRGLTTSNILLSIDWEAKITDFGFSLISPNNQDIDYVFEEKPAGGSQGYIDPTYEETSTISKASDIYSFGVVLFEILCGKLVYSTSYHGINQQYLGPLAKNYYEQRKLDELVFEGIKEQIVPQSLSTFADIAYKCLHDERHLRPTAGQVVKQLKEALEFQVDFETWEPKLPSDYKAIIQQSRTPEIYTTKKKKDLYDMLCEGILIQKGKVWFWLDSNNNSNEMVSATLFTYKNQSSQKWRRIHKSRFQRVPMMMDISNLKIQTQIKAQFLTPSITYGVYLVFKFGEPNQISGEQMYVNLMYKRKDETFHAYFATWRDEKWLMIELYRFLNTEDAGDFEVFLESFSQYYCRSRAIYIEGIEFRAIDNVTHKKIEKLKDVQQTMRSNVNMGQIQHLPTDYDESYEFSETYDEGAKLFQLGEMSRKKHLMLSAKEVMYDSSMKPFKSKPSEQSSFQEVIEVLSQQVFRLKCKIESRTLSPDTDYRCYLIFKLSEKCFGLHCPVKVRDLLHRSNKKTKAFYFRTPKAWNIHDINQVPQKREDGWMEVNVWKFNSRDGPRNGCIHVNLKVISYEGTMSGLIVCGLEFRPM
ncbi:putative protein kinase RLK-Pelle-L-LEC family [Helianthus annuus]|nr:putative protein kinase RLK-Pelle-L-LEC family [Helianthus annuus]KAJ0624966.1 putative protein kinase RLK-Pelle-L-LEC family [Helianthus annuus]KAJ0784955.1 putative protein kinase RLK-Pelle-L-LEC family [Helianthus annuus]